MGGTDVGGAPTPPFTFSNPPTPPPLLPPQDGQIELSEYKAWVVQNPESMNFIKELHSESQQATRMIRQSAYFKRLSMTGSPMLSHSAVAKLQEQYGKMDVPEENESDEEESQEENGAVDAAVATSS